MHNLGAGSALSRQLSPRSETHLCPLLSYSRPQDFLSPDVACPLPHTQTLAVHDPSWHLSVESLHVSPIFFTAKVFIILEFGGLNIRHPGGGVASGHDTGFSIERTQVRILLLPF